MCGGRANTLDRRSVLVAPASRRRAASIGMGSHRVVAGLVIYPPGLASARLSGTASNARALATVSDLKTIRSSAVGPQCIEPDGRELQSDSPERDQGTETDSPG